MAHAYFLVHPSECLVSSVFRLWPAGISKEVVLQRNLLSALPVDFLVGTALQREINAESLACC